MCRCFKLWRRPLEGVGVSFIAESSSRAVILPRDARIKRIEIAHNPATHRLTVP